MNKKFWISVVVVFITFSILDFLIHQVILGSYYEDLKHLYRPEEEMKMWLIFLTTLFFCFFFVHIFKFGYKGTGIMEGLRYGLYVGLLIQIPFAYGNYAVSPIPYYLALLWFIFGTIEITIGGIITAAIYGKTEGKA